MPLLFALAVLIDSPVTLTVPASDLGSTLAEISQATGVRHEAAENIRREIVLVHVVAVKPQDLRERLAKALNASWKTEGDGWRLYRSSEQARDEAVAEQSARRARLAQWIAESRVPAVFDAPKLASELASKLQAFQGARDRTRAELRRFDADGPAGRLTRRALAAIGAAELARIPSWTTVVYATRPTPAERALPSGDLMLRTYGTERQAWLAAAERAKIATPRRGNTIYEVGSLAKGQDVGARPYRVLLRLTRTLGGSVHAYGHVADERGRVIDEVQENANGDLKFAPVPGVTPLPLPKEIEPLREALASRYEAGVRTPFPNAVLERFLQPENVDPLRLVASPLLLHIARRRGVDLIASLPDDVFALGLFGRQELTEEAYLQGLGLVGVNVSESPGWMIAQQTNPAARIPVDRKALGAFVRRLAAGPLSVDEEAAFALRFPRHSRTLATYREILAPRSPNDPPHDEDLLRLYGMLTPEQRRTAARGLRMSDLSSSQLAALGAWVNAPFRMLDAPPLPASGSDDEMPRSELHRIPAEALPNGLPREGILTIKSLREDVAVVPITSPKGGRASDISMTAREFAFHRVQSAQQPPDGESSRFLFEQARPASRDLVTVELELGADRRLLGKLSSQQSKPSGFSKEWEGAVQKGLERYRNMFGAPGRGVPPPNPPPLTRRV